MVTVRYNGSTFTGRILSAKLIGRELFVTIESERFKIPKCLHHTHVTIVRRQLAQAA